MNKKRWKIRKSQSEATNQEGKENTVDKRKSERQNRTHKAKD